MEEVIAVSSLNLLVQKLDSLKQKVLLHKTLTGSLSQLNECSSSIIKSTLHSAECLLHLVEWTSHSIKCSSNSFEWTSPNNKRSSHSGVSYSHINKLSSSSGEDTLQSVELLPDRTKLASLFIKEASEKLKLNFYFDYIPNRIALILTALWEKKNLSVAEMMKIGSISVNSVWRHTSMLRKLGWIKFNGSRKNGNFSLTVEGEKVLKEIERA